MQSELPNTTSTPNGKSGEKFSGSIFWWVVGAILIICILVIIFDSELRHYLESLIGTLYDDFKNALAGGDMIELLILFLAYFCPVNLKPLAETENSLRTIFFWKFLSNPGWRTIFTALFLIFWNFFMISPYHLYNHYTSQFNNLSNELSVVKERLRLRDEYQTPFNTWQNWKADAWTEFMERNYSYSAQFFERATNEEPIGFNEVEVQDSPFYFLSILKINQMENGNSDHLPDNDAIQLFEYNMIHMKNHAHSELFIHKDPSDYFSQVSEYTNTLNRLEIVKDRIEPRAETNFVQKIIDSIVWMTNNTPK
jgi:hypothetical protein